MAFFQKTAREMCAENPVNKVVELPVSAIVPNPAQPRVIFDDYELSRLAVSIQQNGILQPLTVRRLDNNLTYELIAGERRLRACKLLNMSYVPCIIITASVKDSAVLAVLENLQRSDLSFMEEAYAIKNLIDFYGLTQEETAARLGTAQSTIANKLRLRPDAIHYIGSNGLNTAQTDAYIDSLLNGKPQKPKVQRRWNFRAVNLYINTFNKTIDAMKEAGINCETVRNRTEDFVEYVVKIPLKQSS